VATAHTAADESADDWSDAALLAYLATIDPALTGPALAGRRSPARADHARIWLNGRWLAEVFEVTEAAVVDRIALATDLLLAHVVWQDHRIDGDVTDPGLTASTDLLGNIVLVDALASCAAIAADARFWLDARVAFEALANGYLTESAVTRAVGDGPPSTDLLDVVADRYAVLRIPVSALGWHTGHPQRVDVVWRALRHLAFGVQLKDDLTDWRDDHMRARPTYPLMQAAHRCGAPLQECTSDQLADAMFLDGVLERVLQTSSDYLRASLAELDPYPHTRFNRFITGMLAHNARVVENVTRRKAAFLAAARG